MNPLLQKICGVLLLCMTIPSAYLLLCAPIVGGSAGLWVMDQAIEMNNRLLLSLGVLLVTVGGLGGYMVGAGILLTIASAAFECFGMKTPFSDKTPATSG